MKKLDVTLVWEGGRGGEEGGTWSHGAHTAPASMPMNLREKGRETNVRYVSGLDLDQKTHF